MIDGEDECTHNNKGGPLRVHRSHLVLKKTKLTSYHTKNIEQEVT